MAGWTIAAFLEFGSVAVQFDGGDSLVSTTTTDASGNYSLTLKPGSYIVLEKGQSGWTESFPATAEIGRASCRATNDNSVTRTSEKKKTRTNSSKYDRATKAD